MLEQIKTTAQYLLNKTSVRPEVGIILGTGLGGLVREIETVDRFSYEEIPSFPVSTVEGHVGKLVFGSIAGKKVVAMSGRFHSYEGYTASEVVFPIRVMKFLGIRSLFISNAAGAVNPAYKVGDLMVINDHISQFVPNPLIGANEPQLGQRFPDMSEPYHRNMIREAFNIAGKASIYLHEGVYVAVTGPTFETKAEYNMIRVLGGDVVGMSTVQEVIAAVHMGISCFAISVVTDLAIIVPGHPITHEDVLKAARDAEPKLTHLFQELIAGL
jgi:purine-nucleoside phosphorylase